MPHDTPDLLRDAATHWYDMHLGEHLHHDRTQAALRCAYHLIQVWNVSPDLASDIALQVLGTVESRSSGVYIDLDRSTSHALFIVDPATGWRAMLSAVDVVRLARIAAGAPISAAAAVHYARTH